MYCTQCGALLADSARFCGACGTPTGTGAAENESVEQPPPLPRRATQPIAPPPRTPSSEARYAGFGRRVIASLLDNLVLGVVSILLAAVAAAFMPDTFASEEETAGFALLYYLGSWIIGWLYFAIMHSGERQASLGKRALGIKVTDLSGQRISFARASGRYVAYLIVCIFTFGIGLAMAGFTRRRQALHDMMAGTLVVSRETTAADVEAGLHAPKANGLVTAAVLAVMLLPIVGILAAIAIPAYQDYLIRSQVSEGLMMAAPLKAAVAEAYASGTPFEEINDDSLGLTPATGKYVKSASVVLGAIVVTYGGEAATALQDRQVVLVPGEMPTGDVVWMCGRAAPPDGVTEAIADYADYTDVEAKYLPSSCR